MTLNYYIGVLRSPAWNEPGIKASAYVGWKIVTKASYSWKMGTDVGLFVIRDKKYIS